MKKIVIAVLTVASIVLGIQLIPDHPEKTALEVTTTGDDRVLLVGAVYEPTVGRSVAGITCDGSGLTLCAQGYLSGSKAVELWKKINPALGTVPVTITMSEDCKAETALLNIENADQADPFEEIQISVGEGISSCSVDKSAGDATALVIFSSPSSATLTTPAGFIEIESEPKTLDTRVTVLMDDDASEETAALSFSSSVDYAAFIVGVNLVE